MHPIYLSDYINRIKADIANDIQLLRSEVDRIKVNLSPFEGTDLDWYMTTTEANAHLFKHHLHQLSKKLEGIDANTKI